MKKFVLTTLLLLVCLVCIGLVSTARLHFTSYGFSIEPLESVPTHDAYQALMMFLPPSGGFAPNVNVQIQPYAGTIEEYAILSKGQFAKSNLKLIKETKQGDNSVLFEYCGKMQGYQMHWYAKAIGTGKAVYLVTATAAEAQWNAVANKLKRCVHSFAINTGK